jgi:thioredoxin-like negative regulator of GroEL
MAFGWEGDFLTPELVREALDDTFAKIRRDIAPRNASARAPLMAEPVDPEAGADPAFAQAVKAARSGDVFRSCTMWEGLHAAYPEAPAVMHNLGACAEASGNYERAQTLYAGAVEKARGPFSSGKGVAQLLESLERISGRRQGETVIEALTAPRPDPAAPATPES